MKYIRSLAAVLTCCAALCASRASGQVSVQRLGLNLTIHYQADSFLTNADLTATNETSLIHTAYINANDIMRAIRFDWGSDWTNWTLSTLVREVNLATGAEGIFLRRNGQQTNVSSYFANILGASYGNDFTAQVPLWFPAFTNNFTPPFPLERGSVRFRPAGVTTNYASAETFIFSSFNSSNISFNLVGLGPVNRYVVKGRLDGVLYSNLIDQINVSVVGTLMHNIGTNTHNDPGVPGNFVSGTAEGVFATGVPVYLAITNGP